MRVAFMSEEAAASKGERRGKSLLLIGETLSRYSPPSEDWGRKLQANEEMFACRIISR